MARPRKSQRVFSHLQWAFEQKLSAPKKSVLITLAFRADDFGSCFPSIKRLEADTGLYRETIMDAIRSLEAAGLVVIERKSGCVNRYLLACSSEETSRENPTGSEKPTSRQKPTHQSAKADYYQSVKADSEEANEETIEETREGAHPRKPAPAPSSSSKKRQGTTLEDDFRVPDEWVQEVMASNGWAPQVAKSEAKNFEDHYTAGKGKNVAWTDWHRAWLNWCRKSFAGATAKSSQPKPADDWMGEVIV